MKKKDIAVLPIYFTGILLPMVTSFTFQPVSFSEYPWFPNQDSWLDVFLHGKSCAFVLISGVMAVCLLYQLIKEKENGLIRKILPPGVMGVLLVLSAVFSEYRELAYGGSIGQYESLWVLLGYLITGCYCCWYVRKTGNIRKVTGALLIGAILPCLLGVTQLVQQDFWSTSLGRQLLVPESMASYRESLRFNFAHEEWGRVYMSLNNPHYAAIYLMMLLPLAILWGKKSTYGLAGIALACLAGTFSQTAWAAVGILGLIVVWCFDSCLGKRARQVRIAVTLVAATGIVLLGILNLQPQNAAGEPAADEVQQEMPGLQEVVPGQDTVKIRYNDCVVFLGETRDAIGNIRHEIRYEDGTKVPLGWAEELGEIIPEDQALQGLRFKVYEKDGISYVAFVCQELTFRFTKTLSGTYEYVSLYGKIDELREAESLSLFPDNLLNGRGYIWNRSIPLIGENFWLGSGPDTFLLAFPQDDYVARINVGTTFFKEILTNAHNLYLQMALQTGVPSLLCFLMLVIWYLRKVWNCYVGKNAYTEQDKLGIACALGVLGYLICGATWASSICTSPFFWILLGSGVGLMDAEVKKQ